MIEPKNKYLSFREVAPDVPHKTRFIAVYSATQDTALGCIKWYGPWRQYCFFPNYETVFNSGCLDTIRDYCRYTMWLHNKGNQNDQT